MKNLPPIILGGDPFSNQFRYLYRKDHWWKLHDENYCLSVMRSAYAAGCRAYDLSFQENVQLFKKLAAQVDDPLIGFGNPTWEQGVMFDDRFIFFIRDRILRTLVERIWPTKLARLVDEKLSHEDVLVFGYDRSAPLLSDTDINNIYLDEQVFCNRISIFKGECQYLYFGGSDADYLVSLGRMDLVDEMRSVVKSEGFIPLLLSQYPSLVLPEVEKAGVEVEGYVIPLNRAWSWFNLDDTMKAVKETDKPVIAFMAFSSSELKQDIKGALAWLYEDAGVDSILFGTATAEHAFETTKLALST
jgi:hypothetical protein